MFSRAFVRSVARDVQHRTSSSNVASLSGDRRVFSTLTLLIARASRSTALQRSSNASAVRTFSKISSLYAPRGKKTTSGKKSGQKKSTKKSSKKTTKRPSKSKTPTSRRAKKSGKQLTELQTQRRKVNDLRKAALLKGPKQLPSTTFLVVNTENIGKGANLSNAVRDSTRRYRNLSPNEREHYQNIANENKRVNERRQKDWIESYTPDQIRIANNARRQLNRIAREPKPSGSKTALVAHAVRLLKDERLVKRAQTPYIAFMKERFESGDFNNVPIKDSSKSIAREWRALSRDTARKYHEEYAARRSRYIEEYNRVFGAGSSKAKQTSS